MLPCISLAASEVLKMGDDTGILGRMSDKLAELVLDKLQSSALKVCE